MTAPPGGESLLPMDAYVAASHPRISVIMPVFDGEAYLAEAVESVLGQSLSDLELIVVDDGSQDGSRAILERFAEEDPRLHLIVNETNLGAMAASNLAWQAARAPYVARLDADDVALPDRLSRQVAFLDAHPRVAAVGGAIIRIDSAGRRGATIRFPTGSRGIRRTLRRHNCLAHSAVAMRRSALLEIGGYRLEVAEDFDIWLRLSERWELANLPEPVGLYREHPAQVTFVKLEGQTTAALAVRAAARSRRAGRSDPLDGARRLTPELLERLEVGPEQVATAVERVCLELAAAYELLGHGVEAAALLAQARASLGKRAERAFAAALALKRADVRLGQRRPVSALAQAGLAVLNAPGYSTARLAARLRDRTNGRMFW